MPKRLFHSICVQEEAVAADGVVTKDLVVNPLSVLLLNIKPLNDTGTLSNFARDMALAGALDRISVLWRGQSVFSMSGRDCLALNYFRNGCRPYEANGDDVDNERRCLTLPLIFGRFPYDSRCCIPATKRGELTIELTVDIADTGYDGFRWSAESIELMGAEPKEYERKTTISRTFAATGFNDFDLPNGNLVRGMLLFGTTPFGGANPAPTWGRVECLLDNEQRVFGGTDFECAHQLSQLFGRQPPNFHTHNFEPVAGVETLNLANEGAGGEGWENYAWLDFDPTRDDDYSLDTKGSSSFILRANVETADAARVVLVERVEV